VLIGGLSVADLPVDRLPQVYLAPGAAPDRVLRAVTAVGADALVARVGGLGAAVMPASLSAGERQLIALEVPAPVELRLSG
jgi:ATP-binding cassette subfamily C protein